MPALGEPNDWNLDHYRAIVIGKNGGMVVAACRALQYPIRLVAVFLPKVGKAMDEHDELLIEDVADKAPVARMFLARHDSPTRQILYSVGSKST